MELRTHQERNRDHLISVLGSNNSTALDGSDTGTGKSYVAIGVAQKLQARPAIICPRVCIPAWSAICDGFGVEPLFVVNYEKARRDSFEFGGFTAQGKIRRYEWKPDGRVIFVWDEQQRCKSAQSQNSKMFMAATRRYKNLALSATPFTTPLEAYPLGLALGLFRQNQYWNWLFDHGVRKNHFGVMEFVGDESCMADIHHEIFPAKGVRTRRHEIPGFPKSLILPRCVDTGEATAIEKVYLDELQQRREQDKLRMEGKFEEAAKKNNYFDNLPEDWRDELNPLAITVNLRARQEVELLKCDAIEEMARDAQDKGESVAIFVNFDSTIEVLSKRLKTDCILRGAKRKGANNYDPYNCIREFQTNKSPFILANNAAGGTGVSLHDPIDQKPRTSLISPPWSALMLKQILGRVNRDGGGESTQHILFAANTVEERVYERVQSRLNNLDALVDGDLAI